MYNLLLLHLHFSTGYILFCSTRTIKHQLHILYYLLQPIIVFQRSSFTCYARQAIDPF